MKLKIYFSAAILFFSLTVFAQRRSWTIEQCIDSALANNRAVKQQKLTKQLRDIAYQQARNNLLPSINASANQNWNFGRSLGVDNVYHNTNSATSSFGVSANLLLFDGLKMKHSIDIQLANKNASEADLQKIKQDIITSVSTVYLQVLLNKELVEVAANQLEITTAKISQQMSLVKGDKIPEGLVLELIAQQSREEMNFIQAQNKLKLSFLDLAQIMEVSDFENIDVVQPDDLNINQVSDERAEEIYQSALEHRAELKSAEYKLKSAEYEVLSSKSAYYPSLSLGAQIGSSYYRPKGQNPISFATQLENNLMSGIGLTLQVPLFNKFQIRNNVKTSKISVESSKLDIVNTKLELRKAIQQAYYNTQAAKSRWEAANKSVHANHEAYRFANVKYESGKANTYELFLSKNNLTQALSEEIQSKYEYFFRLKILELYK